ncbi:MAG: Ni/Fe hydrogenase subunit alpha [Deltaproteobacteria bacterium]|nr:Ni/Fe hydrogenase subunit alpha [Deltaproteobacteria bacterium]
MPVKKDLHIRIDELTRVEGHGNVVIDLKKGRINTLNLEIIESPRFFEVMLRGRKYDEAHHIMSRICGICAVSHTSASLKAIEAAMKINISRQATLLRKLAFCAEVIQSHVLHLYFLVFPDFLGEGSIVPIMSAHPEITKRGLMLKRLANEICAKVAGRHIHPISLSPGGVTHTPKPSELKKLKAQLEASFDDLEYTVDLLSKVRVREFTKPREYISLKDRGEYGIYGGVPCTSRKYPLSEKTYAKKLKEYVVPHSAAKHAKSPKGTYMVGALARLNNNWAQLGKRARAVSKRLGLSPVCHNPFHNNTAQLVECFHLTGQAISLIDELLDMGVKKESLKKPKGFGVGFGLVEAPRGTLYHEYAINKDGIVETANCIIPTAQNLRSIEEDLREMVPEILDLPKEEIRKAVESLVRAYDPCISCSTHIMNVRFE